MDEMHLREPGFIYSAWGQFTKTENTAFKKKTDDSQYIYQNKLDKACFQHDVAYGDFNNLTGRRASDKILRFITHLILLKIQNMMEINMEMLQWSTRFNLFF